MIIQKYNLNMIPDKVPVMVRVSQYDQYSRTIIFSLYDGAIEYEIPSGSTISVRGTKPDHTGFEYPCTFEGNEVSFNIEPQQTVLSGLVPSEIRITSNNEIVGSCNFIINVEPTPLDESTVISDTELPLIEEASQAAVIAQGAAARAEAEADRAESVLSSAVKSVNNTLPDAQGNVNVPTSSPLSAGRGIQISQNSISNVFETLYSPNLNDIKYNYQSYVYNAANKPSNVNGSGKLISVFSGGDTASHGVQMFSPYNNNDLYIRSYNTSTSTWTSWEKIQKSPELLWTNASVSSPFSAQTISLDLSRYNGVWIVFVSTNRSNSQYNSILLFDNLRYRIEFVEPTSETYGLIVVSSRIVTKTNNGLAFDVGSQATTLGFADNDNTRIIPYKIYGV